MGVQRPARILVVAVFAALLAGCAADPVPEQTPTPTFSTEAEAFAAAEATYRAYVDALNQVDLADPETFESVYAWTTGEFNASERESLSRMHADGWKVDGLSIIKSVEERGVAGESLLACVDVSGVTLVDAAGASQVSPERPSTYAMSVKFTQASVGTGLLIADVTAVESSSCG